MPEVTAELCLPLKFHSRFKSDLLPSKFMNLSELNKPIFRELDEPDDSAWFDKKEAYTKRVARIVRAADKRAKEGYRGITCRAINNALGDDADHELTGLALDSLNLYKANLIPERYTFIAPEVRYVDRDKWGKAVEVRGYHFNPHLFPERAVYGKREK